MATPAISEAVLPPPVPAKSGPMVVGSGVRSPSVWADRPVTASRVFVAITDTEDHKKVGAAGLALYSAAEAPH